MPTEKTDQGEKFEFIELESLSKKVANVQGMPELLKERGDMWGGILDAKKDLGETLGTKE